MPDSALRQRLEALNRAPISGEICERPIANSQPDEPALAGGNLQSQSKIPTSSLQAFLKPQTGAPIPGLLRGGDVVENSAGEHLRIRLPLDALWPSGQQLAAARQIHLHEQLAAARAAVEPAVVLHPDFAAFIAAMPDRTLLLDLETCGLAGAALFLVGLLRQIDGAPMVELLVSRNYAEEAAVLTSLWQIVESHEVLVTFNGKSFDWPMVLERSVRHRLQATRHPRLHVDILHHSRRRWRRQLPDCRLQTLERFVCRRHRTGDIPGHRIPAVYAEFVRTGFEREMDSVLHHNAIDLVTLFDLALRLAC